MDYAKGILCFFICLCTVLLRLVGSKQAATVRMLVRDQVQILHAGETLEISCEFYMEDFVMFDNPIIWKKIQGAEESRINIMSNIVSPYIETGRFHVMLIQSRPKYRLVLKVVDVSLEDYGNYTCEVRGTHTTILASLTHNVYIRTPIRSVEISDLNRTITHADIQRTLLFTEGDTCSLHCVSYGGVPPPQMTLHLGNQEITGQFSLDYTSELSGVKGLRIIEHRTERWTDRFKITAHHDNQRLQCIVTVPDLGSNISTVKIRVNYAPIISCYQKAAFVGDKNVFLRCDVDGRPKIGTMFWIVDNVTAVSQGELQEEYWTINIDAPNNNSIDIRLYMREAVPENFKKSYTLVAENTIGTTTHQVALTRKYKHASRKYPSQDINKERPPPTASEALQHVVTSAAPSNTVFKVTVAHTCTLCAVSSFIFCETFLRLLSWIS